MTTASKPTKERPMNPPKTSRGKATLSRIIKAAEKEFGKRGYYNTAINDIAGAAKVAPGTIYIYFEDKYSLYCHLLNQYGREIRMNIAKAVAGLTDRLEIERMGLLSFLQQVRKQPHMYKIIWESLYINPELFVDYYESFATRYAKQIDKAGDELTQMDSTVMAYLLMGISNFIGLKYVFFEKDADLEAVVDEVVKFLRFGFVKAPVPQQDGVSGQDLAPASQSEKTFED